MSDSNVAVLVGSLREGSLNRRMAHVLIGLSPDALHLEVVEIGDLPLYNADLDGDDVPTAWQGFREAIAAVDAVLFVTPEYNRSVPAVLKNAIDVGSRPYGRSVWQGKPGAIVSVSPGAVGGFGANHHLRQSLVFLDIPILQQPEAYIGGAEALFDDSGAITDARRRDQLQKFMHRFGDWVALNRRR